MKKDATRDYITEAFRFYSTMNSPDENVLKSLESSISKGAYLDLVAVNKTIKELRSSGKNEIVEVVQSVYFKCTEKPLRKNEITQRVVNYSIKNYVNERTVWRMLKEARKMCAEYRELNTGT